MEIEKFLSLDGLKTYDTLIKAEIADSVSGKATVEELNAKADAEHGHAIEDVNGLQDSLNERVPVTRTINGKALTSDIVLSADDIGVSSPIIDVLELPTENINENCFYRLKTGSFIMNGSVQSNNFVCYCVDGLPETAKPVTTDMTSCITYYNLADNDVYGYVPEALGSQVGIPEGWYTLATLAPSFDVAWGGVITDAFSEQATNTIYLLLGYEVWQYKDRWETTKTIGRAGEGNNAEVFNSFSNTATGSNSHAEGFGSTASGNYSHAEGASTASGSCSHSEGLACAEGDTSHAEGNSTASGDYSHAEGSFTTASGSWSHSEGRQTEASGEASHAEGFGSTASGNSSHAEGFGTTAWGQYSHSEGCITEAFGRSQHVQGEYNIVDPEYDADDNTKRGKYVHIVGNGTYNNARSNAHTLDWDGNAWYQGDIYVGGTGQDDTEAKKIATEEYVDSIRTHWTEPTYDIQWDGEIGNRHCVINDNYASEKFVKVSHLTPSDEALQNSIITHYSSSSVNGYGSGEATNFKSYDGKVSVFCSSTISSYIVVVREPSVISDVVYSGNLNFDETGTYFITLDDKVTGKDSHACRLETTKEVVNKLPDKYLNVVEQVVGDKGIDYKISKKYLPDGVPYKEEVETVILPETPINDYITVLEVFLGFTEGEKYRVTYRGKDYECICKPIEFIYEGMPAFGYGVGNAAILGMGSDANLGLENTGEPFIIGDCWNMVYPEIMDEYGVCLAINTVMVGMSTLQDGDTITVSHISQNIRKVPQECLEPNIAWTEEIEVPLDVGFDFDNTLYALSPYLGGNPQFQVHVSDIVLTKEELTKCSVQLIDGSIMPIAEENIDECNYGFRIVIDGADNDINMSCMEIVNNPEEFNKESNGCAKVGIYFTAIILGDRRVARLFSNEVMMKSVKYNTIPKEHLPDSVPYIEDPEVIVPKITTSGMYQGTKLAGFVAGETYIVTFNGVDYECVAQRFSIPDPSNTGITYYGIAMGNLIAFSGGNSGEPFIVADMYNYTLSDGSINIANVVAVAPVNYSNSEYYTVSVRCKPEIHKLSEEYLPEEVARMEEVIEDVTLDIRVDGDIRTYPCISTSAKMSYFKISDTILSVEELNKCTVTVVYNGVTIDAIQDSIMDNQETNGNILAIYIINDERDGVAFFVVTNSELFNEPDSSGNTFDVPAETGIYVICNNDNFFSPSRIYSDEVIVGKKKSYKLPNANFEQTDPNGAGYIEGLTRTEVVSDILLEHTIAAGKKLEMVYDVSFTFTKGDKYKVTVDNTEYECEVRRYSVGNEYVDYLGNGSVQGIPDALDTGEPFWCSIANDIMDLTMADTDEHTLIFRKIDIETKIPEKYLPEKTHWTDEALDIKWDGNINGRYQVAVDNSDMKFVKISDKILTDEVMEGSVITVHYKGGETDTAELSFVSMQSNSDVSAFGTDIDGGFVFIVRNTMSSPSGFGGVQPVFKEIGVYFVDFGTGDYISELRTQEVVHKIAAKYLPEIPYFDLVEMGLPPIVPDVAGTGEKVSLTGVDFTEFENALQNGAVRVRVAINNGQSVRHITAMCMPLYDEDQGSWQINALGMTGFTDPTLFVTVVYAPAAQTMFGHSALLQHFTM